MIRNLFNRPRPGVKHMRKHSLWVDMTPMVDLGFLLISFFVITTELIKPRAMNLFMPHDGDPTITAESRTITFLQGTNNTLFYYLGKEEDAGEKNPIVQISWDRNTGIGKIIRDKQQQLDGMKGGRDQMVVIIKPGTGSTYKNLVDILDEMIIHQVTRYAVVKQSVTEADFIQKNQ